MRVVGSASRKRGFVEFIALGYNTWALFPQSDTKQFA